LKEGQKELAILLVAIGGSVLTNLAVNGLGPTARTIAFVVALLVLVAGLLLFASSYFPIPVWLRSRAWAERERQEAMNNPRHPLYPEYWGKSKGFDVGDFDHEKAVAYLYSLYRRITRPRLRDLIMKMSRPKEPGGRGES
jgi:hypothetical protein